MALCGHLFLLRGLGGDSGGGGVGPRGGGGGGTHLPAAPRVRENFFWGKRDGGQDQGQRKKIF